MGDGHHRVKRVNDHSLNWGAAAVQQEPCQDSHAMKSASQATGQRWQGQFTSLLKEEVGL